MPLIIPVRPAFRMNTNGYTLSSAQFNILRTHMENGNRLAFYLDLYRMTGSQSALDMAEISSSSGLRGGIAWDLNNAYTRNVPGYPTGPDPVHEFSVEIAKALFAAIEGTQQGGSYTVPSDIGIYWVARNAWNTVGSKYGNPTLGDSYFPGNPLIVAHHTATGEYDIADYVARSISFNAIRDMVESGGRESILEAWADAYNQSLTGNEVESFLADNPGYTYREEVAADGTRLGIVSDADGNPVHVIRTQNTADSNGAVSMLQRILDAFNDYLGPDVDDVMDLARELREGFDELLRAARNFLPRRDPLALDLDGDGLETLGADGSVLFDHDGDGVTGGTGWIRPDDGLLVLDRNGNGTIDSGRELFGADTILSDGSRAATGFEALADLDSNADGVFDARDAQFANVRVWRDTNQDGISQASELFTLDELGIASISLTPTTTADVNLGNGNIIDNSGFFTRTDGQVGLVGDMLFAMNNFYRDFSGSIDPVDVSDEAGRLPGVRGSGAVRDLVEAATLSPVLLSAVQAIHPGMSREEMLQQVQLILELWSDTSTMTTSEQLLEASGNRTVYFHGEIPASVVAQGADAVLAWREQQHARISPIIAILERFSGTALFSSNGSSLSTGGRTFFWQAQSDGSQAMFVQFAPEQLALILAAFERLRASVYGSLVLDTRLSDLLGLVTLSVDDTGVVGWDVSALVSALETMRETDPARAIADLHDLAMYGAGISRSFGWDSFSMLHGWVSQLRGSVEGRQTLVDAGFVMGTSGSSSADLVEGTDSNNVISAGAGDDMVFGLGGNDTIRGDAGNDVLDGGDGADRLFGGAGNDVLVGGDGSDVMEGGVGDDVYRIRLGDGVDELVEADGSDRIVFEDLDPSSVTAVERHGYHLVIRLGDGQSLTVQNYFYSTGYEVELFQFADGTEWLRQDILDRVVTPGTVNNDVISGDGLVDRIYGFAGSDTLRGNAGDDLLDGGEGTDRLYGGAGSDTLIGGAGSDVMEGDDGDDTYVIRLGDGADQVSETIGNDRVMFEGLNPADVAAVERHGYHLVIRLGSGQSLTVLNYFYSAGYQVELFQFADGTEWLSQEILDRVVTPGTVGNDVISGDGLVDRIYGFAGNDTLRGNAGDDMVDGGEGADRIYGGSGNDTLVGGTGDDVMEGDDGDDTYVIRAGDGADQISETAGSDRVVFEGLDPSSITAVERHGYHLVIRLGTGQSLTVMNYFYSAGYQVETFEFADGVTWARDDILGRVVTPGTTNNDVISGDGLVDRIHGFAGNDTLRGNGGDDLIDGGEGADRMYGGVGNDTLIGGTGNDVMEGEDGDDTYLIRAGDGIDQVSETSGNDRIVFEGLNPADVTAVERHGYHLVIRLGAGQSLTVLNYFYSAGYQVETFEFAGGVTWTRDDVLGRVVTPGTAGNDSITGDGLNDQIFGMAGNDTLRGNAGDDLIDGGDGADRLYGGIGNDTLVGGAGNDVMEGEDGDDTYVIRAGDGADQISETAGSDRVVFEGLDPSSITTVERHGYHLVIRLGTGQSLTVMNYFYSATYQVETFEFAGGVTWTRDDILGRVVTPGTVGNDSITGDGLVDRIYGFVGNDTLRGNAGDDLLDGGDGADRMYGGSGNDTLVGGAGNDVMEGDEGDDTYLIRAGDGADQISETVGNDRIVFEGLNPADVTAVERHGYHLVIRLGTGQSLTVLNYFYSAGYQVETFEFAGGETWTQVDILGRVVTPGSINNDSITGDGLVDRIYGFDGNDTLRGNGGDDLLDGGDGADRLYGGAGNDTLVGGTGNDVMEGDDGNDTYRIRLGDGADQISESAGSDRVVFEGLDPSSITAVERSGYHLVIRLGEGQSLTVLNYFYSAGYQVETFEFAGGVTWTQQDILGRVVTPGTAGNDSITGDGLNDQLLGFAGSDTLRGNGGDDLIDGGEGADRLYGGAGNDVLVGGLGNDVLEGDTGNDVYRIRLGDGSDAIGESAGDDRVVFEDIDPSMISAVERSGYHLVIRLQNGETLTVQNHFYSAGYQVESFEFADGTSWSVQDILDQAATPVATQSAAAKGNGEIDRTPGFVIADLLPGPAGDELEPVLPDACVAEPVSPLLPGGCVAVPADPVLPGGQHAHSGGIGTRNWDQAEVTALVHHLNDSMAMFSAGHSSLPGSLVQPIAPPVLWAPVT